MKKKTFAQIIAISLLSAAGIQAINMSINKQATIDSNLLKTEPDNYFNWKNLKIYYTKKGDKGSPVILLHDLYPSASAEEWTKIEEYLCENHRVYSIDLLGCGRSDKPEITYSNVYYIQLLIDFIKSRICEKTFVIASGYSSSLALMAGVYDSSKFSGMVFINPPSLKTMSQVPTFKSTLFKDILELPITGTFIYNVLFSKNNIDNTFSDRYFYNPFYADSKTVSTYYKSAHLGDERGRFLLASLYGNYINMDLEHALTTCTLHTDIIIGSSLRDAAFISKSWKYHKPDINITSVDQTKKFPHLEEPESTASIIEESINQAGQKSTTLFNL